MAGAPRGLIEAGPAVLETLDEHFRTRDHDYALLAAWFDERRP